MRTLELVVNRKLVSIPIDQVIYAEINDKLCKIYLASKEVLNIFISMNELEEKLGHENCIRISRSSLVVRTSVLKIKQNYIYMMDGTVLPFSQRRKKEIMEAYRFYVEGQYQVGKPKTKEDIEYFQTEFGWWDNVPVGFAVLEMILDSEGNSIDFTFRYANEALAQIEELDRNDLINRSFGSIFNNVQKRWNMIYSQVAFSGRRREVVQFSPEVKKTLRILCFQPKYGYCACIVSDLADLEKE